MFQTNRLEICMELKQLTMLINKILINDLFEVFSFFFTFKHYILSEFMISLLYFTAAISFLDVSLYIIIFLILHVMSTLINW